MSNFFTSPSAGPPQFGFAPGIAGPRENFLSQLTQATSGGVTQGPTQLQQSGAKALEGMLGTAPEFNTAANPDSAIPFLQELGPYAPYIQAIESRIKQRLPTELAQVGEKYAGGYGGTSDWLRSLQETQAKGETDIAAAVAPAVLQAQQLGANTALGSVYAGSYMKPTLSPEAQSLQSLISGGTASAPQAYGPSTGEQVLNAMAQLLPWLFSGGGGGFGSPSGGGGSSASGILDFLTGAKNLPELGGKITDWLGGLGGGGGAAGGLGPMSAAEWTNIVNQLGPISDVGDLMSGGFFPLAGSPALAGADVGASLTPSVVQAMTGLSTAAPAAVGAGTGALAGGVAGGMGGAAGAELGGMAAGSFAPALGSLGPIAALLAPLAVGMGVQSMSLGGNFKPEYDTAANSLVPKLATYEPAQLGREIPALPVMDQLAATDAIAAKIGFGRDAYQAAQVVGQQVPGYTNVRPQIAAKLAEIMVRENRYPTQREFISIAKQVINAQAMSQWEATVMAQASEGKSTIDATQPPRLL